jgi:hypothetical protein
MIVTTYVVNIFASFGGPDRPPVPLRWLRHWLPGYKSFGNFGHFGDHYGKYVNRCCCRA